MRPQRPQRREADRSPRRESWIALIAARTLCVLAILSILVSWTGPTPTASARMIEPGIAAEPLPAPREAGAYYIATLPQPALASYRGGLPGLPATSPEMTGIRLHEAAAQPAVRAYRKFLERRQDEALLAIRRALTREPLLLERYRYGLNGFALWLRHSEAAQVARLPEIDGLEIEARMELATDVGPAWSGAEAIWDGSAMGAQVGSFGEGVIVGILDTGINSDHPSFAAVDESGYEHANPLGEGNYLGWCNPEHPRFSANLICNDKLIGMWSHPRSSNDPEDENGHGSHTASTAAGNQIRAAGIGRSVTITRTISGVAPHANVVAFDVCIQSGCNGTASLAAIDEAIAGGVDVLNYSITAGSGSPWQSNVNRAFLAAREAGIFVAVAAGNSGPNPGTLTSNAPWVLTVGNGTHDRRFQNRLVDMSGGAGDVPADIEGAGLTGGHGPAAIVHAAGERNDEGQRDDGRCLEPFPRGTWRGEIVVCDRGEIARVAKGQHVLAGGAGGYILANAESNGASLSSDAHYLPGVHISFADALDLRAWMENGSGHRARIEGTRTLVEDPFGDRMNGSSSRGPASLTLCCRRPEMSARYRAPLSVLKPDVSAPGTDVLAAIHSGGEAEPPEFNLLSGTSMASPHAAGAGALLKQLHPDWTPAEIQSALTLAARPSSMRLADGQTPADPFDRGAGHIDVGKAAQAGLVLPMLADDYRAQNPDAGGDPGAMNLASLLSASCVGSCGWNRMLRSTLDRPQLWRLGIEEDSAEALPQGLTFQVIPSALTLEAGAQRDVRVLVQADASVPEGWIFAELTIQPEASDAGDSPPGLRLPIAIDIAHWRLPRLVHVEAESSMGSYRAEGFQMGFPVEDWSLGAHGLAQPDRMTHRLAAAPNNTNPYQSGEGRKVQMVEVPPDSLRLVAEVAAAEARDVSLWLGMDRNGDGEPQPDEQVCASASNANLLEYCDALLPEAGSWWIMLQNRVGSGNGLDEVTVLSAIVESSGHSGLELDSLSPVEPVQGEPFTTQLTWDWPDWATGERRYGALELELSDGRRDVAPVNLVAVEEAATPTPSPVQPTAAPSLTPLPSPTLDLPSATPAADPEIHLPILHRGSPAP